MTDELTFFPTDHEMRQWLFPGPLLFINHTAGSDGNRSITRAGTLQLALYA